MKKMHEERIPTPDTIPTPDGPFMLLEIKGLDGNGHIDTELTLSGFDEPWQMDILKSMLKEMSEQL